MAFSYAVDQSTRAGRAGHIHDSSLGHDRISRSVGGDAANVWTFAITTATQGATYALSFPAATDWTSAQAVSFVAAGSTTTTIAAEAAAAINATAGLFRYLYASSSSATVTVTYRKTGTSFTITESDAKIGTPAEATAASAGTAIPPGVVVMRGSDTGECELPSATTGVAKIYDATPTAENGGSYFLQISGDWTGAGYETVHTASFVADASATVAEITAGLAAATFEPALPATSVAVADATTKVTVTADTAGQEFTVTGWVDGANAGTAALDVAVATANTAVAFTRSILGVVLLEQKLELPDPTSTTLTYAVGDTVSLGRMGRYDVLLDVGETVAVGDSVYVRCTAGATEQLGACRNDSDSGDSLIWSNAEFVSANFTGLDGQNCATIQVR